MASPAGIKAKDQGFSRWAGRPFRVIVILACGGLAGCEQRPPPAAQPTPPPVSASPKHEEAGVTAVPPASSEVPVAGNVEAPSQVNMDAGNAENQLVKTEVLARIDVMPNLSPEEKDKLYVQVERARGMGKILTIPFASGKASVGAREASALMEAIRQPQLQKFAADPTVVFVVLGFADKKGDEKANLAISLQRAESVVKALKERSSVMNVTHAVGMGSSEMFDARNLDKNRVVEVWAVLP